MYCHEGGFAEEPSRDLTHCVHPMRLQTITTLTCAKERWKICVRSIERHAGWATYQKETHDLTSASASNRAFSSSAPAVCSLRCVSNASAVNVKYHCSP